MAACPAPANLTHSAAAADGHWHTGRDVERMRHAARDGVGGALGACGWLCYRRLCQHLHVRRQLRGPAAVPFQKRKPPATLLSRRLRAGIRRRNFGKLHARLLRRVPADASLQVGLQRLSGQLQWRGRRRVVFVAPLRSLWGGRPSALAAFEINGLRRLLRRFGAFVSHNELPHVPSDFSR